MSLMLERLKFAMALSPVADALTTTKRSDVYSLQTGASCSWSRWAWRRAAQQRPY